MIVFHGTPTKGLKQLVYTEENSLRGGENGLVHGVAIYMTTDEGEAREYATSGGSCYRVKVSGAIFDATDKEAMFDFVRSFENTINMSPILSSHVSVHELIKNTLVGSKCSGVMFAKNLYDIIVNDADLYCQIVGPHFKDDLDAVRQALEDLFSYDLIKLHNRDHQTWVLCLDKDGKNLEILEEMDVE